MPQHPQKTHNDALQAYDHYLHSKRDVFGHVVSVTVLPVSNEWATLNTTFSGPLYEATPLSVKAIEPSNEDPDSPCLQTLGLYYGTQIQKALAEDGFRLAYGFSGWFHDESDGTMKMIDAAPPAVPGTPYDYYDALSRSRLAPTEVPLDEHHMPVQSVQVPANCFVKGHFDSTSKRLSGPLHMSPSIQVLLHENTVLLRPMFYEGAFTVRATSSTTLRAAYIEDSTVTLSGQVEMVPIHGYTEITNVGYGEIAAGMLDSFMFYEFLNGPHRPIRDRESLKSMIDNDPDPTLMSPSFGDTANLDIVLSKQDAKQIYPCYTLRKLLEIPQRVLSQNLFWHRGSMTNSRINLNGDLVLNDMLIQRSTVHVPAGSTLRIRRCMVLELTVTGSGRVVVDRTPCYRLNVVGPVTLVNMNHFTPVIESSSQGDPLELDLTGRVLGLHKKMYALLTSKMDNPKHVVRLPYWTGRPFIKDAVNRLNTDQDRFNFLLSLYKCVMDDPESDLRRKKTDTAPYFMKGLDQKQLLLAFIEAEKPEPVYSEELYRVMAANL